VTVKIDAQEVSVRYGSKLALKPVSLHIHDQSVLALIGPSGCGKSTFLRCLNRMNDTIEGCTVSGRVLLDDTDIYASDVDPVLVRRRVGMVFQRSNPFPRSIFDNVAFGLHIGGERDKKRIVEKVERALEQSALWDEVKDRLDESAMRLSGGQQQRLCIARALAVEPEVILMDEPASALDPIAAAKLEELIVALGKTLSIVVVTHNMQQARRVASRTAFFYMGDLVEVDATTTIFENPKQPKTQDYVLGRFG
jgi:phosphate transport system ATP-binding protein